MDFDFFTEIYCLKFGEKSYLVIFYRKYPILETLFSVDYLENTDFTEKDAFVFGETRLNLDFHRNS